jgi:hypothetical protein
MKPSKTLFYSYFTHINNSLIPLLIFFSNEILITALLPFLSNQLLKAHRKKIVFNFLHYQAI